MNWISPHKPALVLAPMEGVTDSPMRALMAERGGFSFCVAEFLRISHEVLPTKSYYQHMPELIDGCTTPSGTPVQLQLLGGDPHLMAASAVRGIELGARAIDINFGCPAPLVNRHDGGAAILKYPHRIREIVQAVREALPAGIPVSAKLRLGWDSVDAIFENAKRAAEGGASWITIHARTKAQGYRPPVNWKIIGEVRKSLPIPVVANGDIWTREDFLKCAEESGCVHFMLGRGALADPSLPHFVARELGISGQESFEDDVFHWRPLIERFAHLCQSVSRIEGYAVCRTKQWLKMANNQNPAPWFDQVKTAKSLSEILDHLENHKAEFQRLRLNSVTSGSDLIEDAVQLVINNPEAALARLSAT